MMGIAAGHAGRRSAARLAVVQALYRIEVSRPAVETVIAEIADGRQGVRIGEDEYVEVDHALLAEVVRGAMARRAEIDLLIAETLDKQRRLERLEAVLRALLRAGTYELLARHDVPARVVINEYVDIAHAYFGGREPDFANGVLDRLGRRLRPDEMGRQPDDRPRAAG